MKIWTSLACASALALATAGCNRDPDATDGNAQARMALPALPATLPLEAGDATEIAPAPSASDLPDARPLRLARVADPGQAYGYADAAYSYDEALGDAPPDYGFDYDGADPWAWQGYDDSLMVAEPIDDGYRYYYYRPGAEEPYFVRDPFYAYGFANGLLAVVYGADGGIVRYADYGPRLIYASRYYARGRQLWGASRRGKRQPVIAANWLRQRPVLVASRERWGAGRARQPDWQRYAEGDRARQASYWRTEQVRRQADARRFDGWRQSGFRSAPPPRAIPVAWEKAQWAKDDRRYRPAADAVRDQRGDGRDDRQQAGRRDDRRDAQADQRQREREQQRQQADAGARRDDRQRPAEQAQRQAEQAQRQAQNQADRARQQDRARRQQQADAGRQQAERAQVQAQRQAQREQQQAARRRDAEQAQARQQRAERQQADGAQARQAQRQAQQAERRQSARAEQRPAQQTERAQRRQAERGEARQAQLAQRQQQQAEARQAQQAQRQQAQQAARQQQQAEARQAQQAQRQQAQQAERQQQQAQQRQAQQAERQQQQQQRQQQRQERRDGRGPN